MDDEDFLLLIDFTVSPFSKSVRVPPSLVVALGLKKPFKLCWPFVGVAAVEPDCDRFKDLLADISIAGRFLLVVSMVFFALVGWSLSLRCNIALVSGLLSLDIVAAALKELAASVRDDIGGAIAVVAMVEGLRANISRMLRRPSNSGMSLPDSGKMSFVEYILWRWPSTNIPVGFIRSRKCILPSLSVT